MDEQEVEAGPVVKVARDLSEIVAMTAQLDEQAEHKANANIDGHGLPGGLAMVALAPVANLEAWLNRLGTAERTGRDVTPILEDEDETWEPPLQTLLFWSEDWRRTHDADYDSARTIATEATFIRHLLAWAWDNEPRWDDLAQDIRDARVRMENVLYAGNRVERTRIECDQCDNPRRLVKLYGRAEDGSEDIWKCPACRARFDADGMKRAHAKMLRSEQGQKFVDQADAIATLRTQGRGERTVRRWLSPLQPVDLCAECGETWPHQEFPACPKKDNHGDECGGLLVTQWDGDREAVVEAFCDIATHRRFVWWPDLWRRHLSTRSTNRTIA